MTQLVKDLEVLSNISADVIPIKRESFDLRELLRRYYEAGRAAVRG